MQAGMRRRDARVIVALLTGLIAGSAVGGGAVYLFGSKRPKHDVTTPKLAKADELGLVPADALAFLHVRAADAWKNPALAEVKKIVDKAGPDAINALDASFAPAPSSIDRVTVVVLRPNANLTNDDKPNVGVGGFTPGGDNAKQPPKKGAGGAAKKEPPPPPKVEVPPQPPEIVFVLSFSTPFKPETVRMSNLPSATEKTAGTRKYWHDTAGDVALFFPPDQGDRVLVVGSGKGVEAFAIKMGHKEGPLAASLLLAAEGNRHIVGALNTSDAAFVEDFRKSLPDEVKSAFAPLLNAKSATASVILDGEATKLEIRLAYKSDSEAAEYEKKLRTSAESNRQSLEEPRKKLEEAIKGKVPGQPRSYKEFVLAGSSLLALGTLNLIDDFLKDPPLKVEGSEVVATIMLPSLAETSLASNGIALGVVGMTFGYLTLSDDERPPVIVPKVVKDSQPPPMIKPKTVVIPEPEPKPMVKPMPKPLPKTEPEPEPKTEPKTEPKPKPKPNLDPLRDLGFDPKL